MSAAPFALPTPAPTDAPSVPLALAPTPRPRPAAGHVTALADALATERRLLDDLIGVLASQRSGVSTDDLEIIDDSVYAAQRVLLTLQQARRRRRALLGLVAGREDVTLGELDAVLGPMATPDVLRARDELVIRARELTRELEKNRAVLDGALRTGDRLIRALTGRPEEPAVYTDGRTGSPGPLGPGLLNTQG